jgi:2-polyprenyl-6-methoxyphenol hydroxylase-like FAD-dependent oxidoreductase
MNVNAEVFVIGAGPAGLTAAYCLSKEGRSVLVIEKDPFYVGGISRTVRYKDFLFDIGVTAFSQNRRKWWTCGARFCRTTSSNGRGFRASITRASTIRIR